MKFLKAAVVGVVFATVVYGAVPAWASKGDEHHQEVKGTLSAVDIAGQTVTVNSQTYSVSLQVEIEVEHQGHISLAQLVQFIGSLVELKLDAATNTVLKIEVKSSANASLKVKGLLNAVDVPNRVITVDTQTYSVSLQVKIEAEHVGRISFDQLVQFVGKFVELKLDAANTVVKIEVKGGKSKGKSKAHSTPHAGFNPAESASLEVFDLSGKKVFQSDQMATKTLEWHLQNAVRGGIPNGIYFYLVVVRSAEGTILKSEVKKLLVLR